MATQRIDTFIVGLQLAEKSRLEAVNLIGDHLFRLACFLAKLDRQYVQYISFNGFIAPIPVDLSPSSLYDWRFLKQGTVRDGEHHPL